MKPLLGLMLVSLLGFAQEPVSKPPSAWWVHGSVFAHLTFAAMDGLSSWKQGEGNVIYQQNSGIYAGRFYRSGAARLTGITLSFGAASELLGILHPKWRRYISGANLGAAGAHVGVTVSNIARNPYYR